MKILHVINTLKTGGAEKLVSDLIPLMIRDGYDVEIAIFVGGNTHFYRSLKECNVTIHTFSTSKSVYNIGHMFKLRKLMKRFDVVHTHNTSPQLFAAICSIGLKCKLITTEHSGSNRRRGNKLFAIIDRWMYRRYTQVVCISDQAEKNLREHLKSYLSKISTIYNGINIAEISAAKGITKFRKDLPSNAKIITMVAGFRWEKDQPTIIRALQFLPENFYLCLVGDGPRKEEYTALVSELNLMSRVLFLGIRNDIAAILKSSDYIVMSSHFEGLSLSSLEGMCSGRPFLASDVDGLHEIVQNAGVLFPHQDAESFAREILRLNADEKYRNKVIEKCRLRVSQYDISKTVKSYESLYLTL